MQAANQAHPAAPPSRKSEAETQFRKAVDLHGQAMSDDALAALTSAIDLDPDHLDAHRMRAVTLTALGRHAEAVTAWETICLLDPDLPGLDGFLADAFSNAGRHGDALVLLNAAARLHPDPGLLRQIGTVLMRLGRFQQAVDALLRSADAEPGCAATLSTLGIAFLHCDDLDGARFYAGAAFQIAPDYGNAINFSRILLDAGAFDKALAVSWHAMQIRADSLPARNNHALALEGLGRNDDAVQAWRDALAIAPDDTDLAHKLATLLLGLGHMTPETWALYERRLNGKLSARAIRRWQGEDVAGKTVLLHAEQGLGDTLQFVRYVPLVAGRGARVVLAVQPSLTRLFATVPGVDQIAVVGGTLPAFDLFCPLLSLPAIFGTTLDTIPLPLPYGMPATERAPGDLRVGLVWAGNPGFVNDRRRSIAPDILAPLTQLPGVRCYSLQCGIDTIPPGLLASDMMQGVSDFADTATRIAGLDLVISVDTAVAHLAATMGKPVWLLSRFLGCWRWLHDRPDSPWYPTMQIYRQSRANDWTAVIEEMTRDLASIVANPRTNSLQNGML